MVVFVLNLLYNIRQFDPVIKDTYKDSLIKLYIWPEMGEILRKIIYYCRS